MTEDEWLTSRDAVSMLRNLWLDHGDEFIALIPSIQRFFLACCKEIKDLLPDEDQLEAVLAKEAWLDGALTDDELRYHEWAAEGAAFGIESPVDAKQHDERTAFVEAHPELSKMSSEQAARVLVRAAYFVDFAICYPNFSSGPYVHRLMTSEFLSADLLRQYLSPKLC